jgi:hypothetical protein
MNRSTRRNVPGTATFVTIASILLAALAFTGCATGGAGAPGSAADVPSAPAAPAKKPFEPPAWEANVYANEELGFSVHYPKDFTEQPAQDGGLFTAASPMQVPRVDVSRFDATPETTLDAVLPMMAEGLGAVGGGEATVRESRQVELRDEVTPAIEGVIEWSFQGFPLQSFVLGTIQGDTVVAVTVTGMQGGELSELSDIAYTLYFE